MDLSRSEVQQFLTDVSATHDPDGYKDAETAAITFHAGLQKFRDYYRNDPKNIQRLEQMGQHFDKFYAVGKAMAAAYVNKGMDAGNLLMKDRGRILASMPKARSSARNCLPFASSRSKKLLKFPHKP